MDSLITTIFIILIFVVWFIFLVNATRFHFLTTWTQIKQIEIHWTKRFYWWYGFGFFLFMVSIPVIATSIVLAKLILKGI